MKLFVIMKLNNILYVLLFIFTLTTNVISKNRKNMRHGSAASLSVENHLQRQSSSSKERPGVNGGEISDLEPDSKTGIERLKGPGEEDPKQSSSSKKCWMNLNAGHLFEVMDELDGKYHDVRKQYQEVMESDKFDEKMISVMIPARAAADRAALYHGGRNNIPAGANLGGYCMMRLPDSILFFHRIKLRNETFFRVAYLHNDLYSMTVTSRIQMGDLHLVGSYERAITDNERNNLFYRPTYGEVEFLLKNVLYKMEGRYRLLQDRLVVELIVSEITMDEVHMKYRNSSSGDYVKLDRKNIDEFMTRLKVDLDLWLKNYFNDHLTFFELPKDYAHNDFQKYDKKKEIFLNEYTDGALKLIKQRLRKLRLGAVKVPTFNIYSVNGLQIKLTNGALRGLDSIHRRSIATGKRDGELRQMDVIVGFSDLKLTYEYEALLNTGAPPLTGQFILSADEMKAHLRMLLVENPSTVDLNIGFIRQAKPESLTVEGAVNRVIANFKHLLENHILSIMSNTVVHHMRLLSTLTFCEPRLEPYEEGQRYSQEKDDGIFDKVDDRREPSIDADHALDREDSAELVLPANGSAPPKKMHLKYNQKLTISEVKSKK